MSPPPALRPQHPSWAQPITLALAAFLWAALWLPTVSALVWAYLAVWLLLALARGRGARWAEVRLPTGLGIALAATLSAPAVYFVVEDREALVAHAQLDGLAPVLADRARRYEAVHVHPPLVFADHPQALWIRAEDAPAHTLRIAAGPIEAARIGPGLFRALYDPRAHGPPADPVQVGLPSLEVVHAIARPRRLVPGPRAAWAVSLETDELLAFGADGVLDRVPVGDGPVAAVATSTAGGFVAHRYEPFVWRTHPRPAPAHRVGHGQVDLAAAGGWLAVAVEAPPAVWIGRPEGPLRAVPLPVAPDRLFFAADARTLIVASRRARQLLRLGPDRGTWRVVGEPLVLGRPVTAGLAIPGGLVVAVGDLRPEDDAGRNHEVREQLAHVDLEAWAVTARRPVFDREADLACAGVANLSSAPEGGLLAVCEGTDALLHVAGDPARLDGPMTARALPLAAPSGLAAGVLTSWATAEAAWLGDAGRRLRLAPDGPRLAGARAFTEATSSGASCATCHPEADSDHAWHDIGHGVPRPTLSVRGLAGTSPYLRGGSYPTLDGLDHFARTILEGYRREAPDRAAHLEAFVLRQPAPFVPGRSQTSQSDLQRGYAAFLEAGCDGCHPGPAFTDLAQYPQPLLFPERPAGVLLDTPSLIGVSATPPYLFDGRAESLRAIFEDHDPSRRHGRYARLDAASKQALFRFLEAL